MGITRSYLYASRHSLHFTSHASKILITGSICFVSGVKYSFVFASFPGGCSLFLFSSYTAVICFERGIRGNYRRMDKDLLPKLGEGLFGPSFSPGWRLPAADAPRFSGQLRTLSRSAKMTTAAAAFNLCTCDVGTTLGGNFAAPRPLSQPNPAPVQAARQSKT